MLGLARSIAVMLVARILQGASAAVVWTLAVTVMTDRIGTKELGQAMGCVTVAHSIAIVVGPVLGGVVYARAGYYAVFALVFAFPVFDILFRPALIEARVARKWDSTTAPLDSEVEMRDEESSKREADVTPIVAADAAFCSPHDQKRGRIANLLPPTVTLLASPRIAIALWGCFRHAGLLCGCDAVVPIFVERTFGWSSLGAGLILLAVVIPGFISPVSGYLSDKHGPTWLSVLAILPAPLPDSTPARRS